MSAHEQMRKMLDNLMGTGRNGENVQKKVRFSDQRVCKNFLLYCCPYEILSTTRYDIGECPKFHSLALRSDYEEASKGQDIDFYTEALRNLRNFLNESERRKQVAKKRLAETQQILSTEEAERLNKIYKIVEQIGELLAKAEQLGAEGKVEETLEVMKNIEELHKQKNEAHEEYKNSLPASFGQQRRLRVCEVCSSYLGLDDNDERLADHFNGRLHMGFLKLFEKANELEETIQEKHIKKILDKEFGSVKDETAHEGNRSVSEKSYPKYCSSLKKCSETPTNEQMHRLRLQATQGNRNQTSKFFSSFGQGTSLSVKVNDDKSSDLSCGTKRKRSDVNS